MEYNEEKNFYVNIFLVNYYNEQERIHQWCWCRSNLQLSLKDD
ncbi:MAG: hypothetical protein ACI4XR_02595 [Bacilli bacterium]